ncbi:MAG TPA: cardiolipin synthase [Planococcus sp. (in: firmicutes)]|nr:cardiolipin synthase [Planococcus sp. (in: firmicutes)]
MQGWPYFTLALVIINALLAATILFYERKKVASAWAWILILFFLPVIGFVLYIFIGKPITKKDAKQQTAYKNPAFEGLAKQQLQDMENGDFRLDSPIDGRFWNVVRMHLATGDSPLTRDNEVIAYTDGKMKFEALFCDIEAAKDHINLQYYIIRDDGIGEQLIQLLARKAQQGISIHFLYDDIGSLLLPASYFQEFLLAGGKAKPSIASKMPINLRLNYRNHRKIAVIDGEIGYIGGFNVGDEYLGYDGKLGYWRDTHLRITGGAVASMQHKFLIDWNAASPHHPLEYDERFFPIIKGTGKAAVQIVESGPDSGLSQIRDGMLKLISRAERTIDIQTPYFIPDVAIMAALEVASMGGVQVRLMIPSKADHFFVHDASLSFAGSLLASGVRVFAYKNGFLHAKMLLVDEMAFTVGSANMDERSFSLNFEANAFVYDKDMALEMLWIFERDIRLAEELSAEFFAALPLADRIKQRIAKLVAPIL